MDILDKTSNYIIILCIPFIVGCLVFIGFSKAPKKSTELLYPSDSYGARIPGTNYLVDGKDTLEIVQSYHYRLLDKEERAQAREHIKSLRK
jgi:hypothetical protein